MVESNGAPSQPPPLLFFPHVRQAVPQFGQAHTARFCSGKNGMDELGGQGRELEHSRDVGPAYTITGRDGLHAWHLA